MRAKTWSGRLARPARPSSQTQELSSSTIFHHVSYTEYMCLDAGSTPGPEVSCPQDNIPSDGLDHRLYRLWFEYTPTGGKNAHSMMAFRPQITLSDPSIVQAYLQHRRKAIIRPPNRLQDAGVNGWSFQSLNLSKTMEYGHDGANNGTSIR